MHQDRRVQLADGLMPGRAGGRPVQAVQGHHYAGAGAAFAPGLAHQGLALPLPA